MENFQDLMVALDAFYWLHKAISIGLSRFGPETIEGAIWPILSGDLLLLRRFYVVFGVYVYFYLRAKEICTSYLDLLN